jgi:hypothetical protein
MSLRRVSSCDISAPLDRYSPKSLRTLSTVKPMLPREEIPKNRWARRNRRVLRLHPSGHPIVPPVVHTIAYAANRAMTCHIVCTSMHAGGSPFIIAPTPTPVLSGLSQNRTQIVDGDLDLLELRRPLRGIVRRGRHPHDARGLG